MKRTVMTMTAAVLLAGSMVTGAQAARHSSDPPCNVTPNPTLVGHTYTVSVQGLPTTTTLNLWVTNPNGTTTGMPLGTVASGAISYATSSPSAGTWSYQISGTNFKLYSSCSVQVN